MKRQAFTVVAMGIGAASAAGCGAQSQSAALTRSSPAGRIAYLCVRGGKAHLCVMQSGGSRTSEWPLAGPRSLQGSPAWSADGSRLLVQGEKGAALLRADGRLIKRFPVGYGFSISSDGHAVAYLTSKGVVVESLDRGSRSFIPGDLYDSAISPDGSRVAYVDNNSLDIYVANADDTRVRRLTHDDAWEELPTWSPDGRRIAYYDTPDDPVVELWVMNSDGSDNRRLVSKGGMFDPNSSYDWPIAWSPGGAKIAYTGEDDDRNELYLVDVRNGKRDRLMPSFHNAAAPSWSSDGTTIAFMSDKNHPNLESGSVELYAASSDGQHVRRLTRNRMDDLFPVWQPHGAP